MPTLLLTSSKYLAPGTLDQSAKVSKSLILFPRHLQQKLHRVQEEIQRVRQQLDALQLEQGEPRAPQAPASPEQAALSIRLRELQEQFSELLLGIRRRKSLATDGTLLDVETCRDEAAYIVQDGRRNPRSDNGTPK
ncbi:hypothetical protein IscW_ISCW023509 [Ixodes scapularis]|uniref:Uncharacterized protein n=1 Tax=Ixodes scapularis TaxID=6945 RepID=B7QMD9_IXOSC|nr:hypothetical protein IscW_ISCW023509 [Ixodes scapularis]|eukprot:XP_002416344.1 hypothetical protein IscW_ISCW023509 [Ixodes scapularis]